ncbi:MAG: AtpZ/AtpI family protein [Actinomycetota bacterium]
MKLLSRISRPLTRTVRTDVRVDPTDGPGQGMDAVVVLVLFLGAGFGLDRLFGTTPIFMIALTVLGAVGLFAKFKYRYEEKMDQLEADRLAKLAGTGDGAPDRSQEAA